jgi:hypothetical protein
MASKKSSKESHVIVRTYSAGVHFGRLVERNGKEVRLANAKRLWYWKGANTLHEIALRGVGPGSKISDTVPDIVLLEAIEVIACEPAAVSNLEGASWAK